MRRIELYSTLPTNEAAITWCRDKGLLATTRRCPTCDSDMVETTRSSSGERAWICRKTFNGIRHYIKVSIMRDSFFAESRLPIKEAIYLLYEWSVLTTVEQASFQLNISCKTASSWYTRFRGLAERTNNRVLSTMIGGEGDIVEIDECQIGHRKHHRGRAPNEVWVFAGVVRGSNPLRLFIECVKKRDRETLTEIIKRRIKIKSTIISDGWGAYQHLAKEGFKHKAVNHSVEFVSALDPTVHTQNVENVWRCFRRFLNSKSAYKRNPLQGYIQEFIFRKSFTNSFETLISSIEYQHPFI